MKNNLTFCLLGLILLVHAFLLTKLIFFPYPELFIYPYLTNHGLLPYSQILDQHFPGLMFLPINLDNLGMNNEVIARVWSIAIIVLTQILLFYISSKILRSKRKALLVNFLYLIWQPFFEGWVLWIDSFLPLILLPAFYALYKRRIFLTGLLLGIGIIFKQVLIPLSGLILIYIFWENKKFKDIYKYLLGLLPPIILMLVYFLIQGTLKDFWYWTVVFNLTVFAQYGVKEVPTLAHLSRVAVVFGASLFALFSKEKKIVYTLLIFLMGSLAGVFARFDFVHFQPALPFAIIATVYGLGRLGGLGKLGVTSIYGLILIWWLIIFYKGHLGDRVISFDSQAKDLAVKIKHYTNPGEKIFVFGAAPHLYQMADRLPAGNIFVFQFPWFMMVAEDRILAGLLRDQPQIIVADRMIEIEGQKITDFASKIDKFIQENYYRIDNVGSTLVLQKRR